MVEGHALNHLLNEDGLTHAGAPEQADLAALNVGGEQVNDLNAGLEHLLLGLQLVEGRGLAVNGPALTDLQFLALTQVEHIAGDIEDVALGDVTNRYGDGGTGVVDLGAAHQAVSGLQ